MTKKQQLYYLLKAFLQREYDVATFCEVFESIFYPDIPSDELTSGELAVFNSLAEVVDRFSPFDEDFTKYPNVYRNEEEVKKAIYRATDKLIIER